MAGFYLVSHPRTVREALERHRRGLDANPIGYLHEHSRDYTQRVHECCARYLGVEPLDIALTDSTTMGLGLVYSAIALKEGQEVLCTEHDHYSTNRSLELRAQRSGAAVRRVRLYEPGGGATVEGIVSAITGAITPATRVLAVTWVHSSSGVKLPLRAIADAIEPINQKRSDEDRIIFCVDGVHGLGIDDVTLPELGCDVFIAGTHKWLFGPRGTGLVWARPEVQQLIPPTIPPFPHRGGWRDSVSEMARGLAWGVAFTPGGFHSFEHRWAVAEAVEFHESIGRARVSERIHGLNRQLKEGLAKMDHVTLHTPMPDELSAGITCFEVRGLRPDDVVQQLEEKAIVASTSPYAVSYARLAPSLLNDEAEVETCLKALAEMA
jgi:selenocysteine lyase/cysteine desulfurase